MYESSYTGNTKYQRHQTYAMSFIEASNKYVIIVCFLNLEKLEQAVNVTNTRFFPEQSVEADVSRANTII